MSSELSSGILQQLYGSKSANLPAGREPVLQIIRIKDNSTADGRTKAFGLTVSDGVYCQAGIVTPLLNTMVESGQLTVNTVFRLDQFEYMEIPKSNSQILVLLAATPWKTVDGMIGKPIPLVRGVPQQQHQQQQQQQQPPQQHAAPPLQHVKQEPPAQYQQHNYQQQHQPQTSRPPQQQFHQQQQQQYQPQYQQHQSHQQPQQQGGSWGGGGGAMISPGMSKGSSYQPPQQGYQQRSMMDPRATNTVPIAALNPYLPNWTIKARVSAKSSIRTYESKRDGAPGRFFTMVLQDQQSEIRAALFQEAVDALYDKLENGKVYLISRGKVKFATRAGKGQSEYEMTLGADATVVPCPDDSSIPMMHYHFVPSIAEIANYPNQTPVDVIGVLTSLGDLEAASAEKTNSRFNIYIADMSDHSINVTFWGQAADEAAQMLAGAPIGTVIAVKGAKVYFKDTTSSYGSNIKKSLSTFTPASLEVNPSHRRSSDLLGWWSQRGEQLASSNSIKCISFLPRGERQDGGGPLPSTRNHFDEIDDDKVVEKLSQMHVEKGSPAQYFVIRGTVIFHQSDRDNLWFNSCAQCNRKVEEENHQWRCHICNELNPNCSQRYLFTVMVADHTGGRNLTCFEEAGTVLFRNMSAADLKHRKDLEEGRLNGGVPQMPEEGPTFSQALDESLFRTCVFRIRATANNYGKEKLRVAVMKAEPVNFVTESQKLIAAIGKYSA
ncbi:single-stranded DNA binding [Balamuthia mandrillaris]